MSFFGDSNNFGLAMIIAGLVVAVISIVSIVLSFSDDDVNGTAVAVVKIGTIIYALMVAGMGVKVRSGAISKKLKIVGEFVRIVGLGVIIQGIFAAVGGAIEDTSVSSAILSSIVYIILGLIVLWVASSIVDGKVDVKDRLFWIILVVVFAILALYSLINAISNIVSLDVIFIANLCYVLIYVFLLLALLSDEVKKGMGMA